MDLFARTGERIPLTQDIAIVILEVRGEKVRVGIEAPQGVVILRSELLADRRNDDSR
jgi:carbon storage regulator CsrA